MDKPVIQIKNLEISFKKENNWISVVRDISFEVSKGETLGIVGESGSGKSVSCLAILGLLPKSISRINNGEIIFRTPEKPFNTVKNPELLSQLRGKEIGMIFQEPMTSLNPVFTCGNQMLETLTKHLKLNNESAKEKALEWFAKVELPNPERIFKSFPHELSGGQRQRVMIAMAMCCEPKLLIADEPTTALDVTVQKRVIELINNLQNEIGTAVIFISHDLGVVKNIADKVLVMKSGEIQEFNDAKTVFHSPKSAYTKGLIQCKPENTPKDKKLITVAETLNGETDLKPINKPEPSDNVILEVKNLLKEFSSSKSFFKKSQTKIKAVDNVSFQIKRGETVGLVGESGCGKSTLSKMISGLMKSDSGEIFFKGEEISTYTSKQWQPLRGKIQFIFQDPYSALNPRKSVSSVLDEVLKKHRKNLNSSDRQQFIFKILEDVGLPEESAYKFPHEFSGGQRQRIVIARALAADPEFIIADESVSALDVSVQAQVLNLLNDLKAEYNLTYLFISHDMSVVHYMSDKILVMKEGKIVEEGNADQVYSSPTHEYTKELLSSIYS